MLCDTFLDSGRVFGDDPQMTQIIEIDDDTAMALKQRAAERGLSVPELVAELVTLEAQGSVAANDDVVRWLQTWGTPAFRNWRNR
jgi:predicted Rossmann fold nucleotide-binding protein DprA/Smf involved in DNA uptake